MKYVLNTEGKSLLHIIDMTTNPYEIKVLYEIQQICDELGIASNETSCIDGYIKLVGRYKNGFIKYEAHIKRLDEGWYNVFFSAFHEKPLRLAL